MVFSGSDRLHMPTNRYVLAFSFVLIKRFSKAPVGIPDRLQLTVKECLLDPQYFHLDAR